MKTDCTLCEHCIQALSGRAVCSLYSPSLTQENRGLLFWHRCIDMPTYCKSFLSIKEKEERENAD